MADGSRIEWTEATWNPLRGCSRVSAGCQHCYAERVAARFDGTGQAYEGLLHPRTRGWNGTVRPVPEVLAQPLRWTRPRRIFVNSMSDLFHESVPDAWIDQVFAIMALAPQHTFQVLTKRAERMKRYLNQLPERAEAYPARPVRQVPYDDGRICELLRASLPNGRPIDRHWPLSNVELGVSVENQAAADERIPWLLETPAACRWISAEPLLGRLDLTRVCDRRRRRALWINALEAKEANPAHAELVAAFGEDYPYNRIDWVVAGGESGPGSRPMHPDWDRSLRDQCAAANVPFYFKQWGDWVPGDQAACSMDDCYASSVGGWVEMDGAWSSGENAKPERLQAAHVFRVGKKRAGRLLDAVLHDAYPIRMGAHP